MKIHKQAFTLVEVLVAITIFGIMMITVMGVYMTSTEITYKADLNRFMQENVKNIVTNISEDVMKNGVDGIKDFMGGANPYSKTEGFALKTGKGSGTGNMYQVGFYDKKTGKFTETTISTCTPPSTGPRPHCYIFKNSTNPISNDLVTVEDIQYRLTGGTDRVPQKLTVFLTLAIAPNVGVRESLVEPTKVHTQFTVSVRKAMVQ